MTTCFFVISPKIIIFASRMDYSINVRGRLVDLSQPQVMGILNATPDSFVAEGGSIIDVGAFSTRPGASLVSEEEETDRLQRALAVVRNVLPDVMISVDTYRSRVARRCVEEWGADIINDVSEGGKTGIVNTPLDVRESMFETVAELGVPYILMSVQPTIHDMLIHWSEEVNRLHALGVKDIILDPGFGFGKTVEENYAVMAELEKLQVMRLPLLVGVSRKSMIWKVLDGTPDTALNGTTVLHTLSLQKGASILRAHDVREAVETVRLMQKLNASK